MFQAIRSGGFFSAMIAEISPSREHILPLHRCTKNARVIQWIGCWSTKPVMEVRILPGAHNRSFSKGGQCGRLKIYRSWSDSTELHHMVTVAERFRRKFVELVYMGSNPICHTRNWGYSSVVEQRPVKPFVVSSILPIPAEVWPRG